MWRVAAVLLLCFICQVLSQKTVGKSCKQSVTCGRGAFCSGSGYCYCLSTYTSIDGYCWKKINPGEAGCVKDAQCRAVWPSSYCSSGTCRCSNNQPPFPTRDGLICVNYGLCPVNGAATKYKYGGTVVPCINGNDASCPSELYDCICSDSTCKEGSGFCCPTRAYACIQPKDEGNLQAKGGVVTTRYYFDPISYSCKPFKYRGKDGNANNFVSKDHCTSYCQLGCYPRGQPRYTPPTVMPAGTVPKSSVIQCTSSSQCKSGNFRCLSTVLRNVCCPTISFICSKYGGLEYKGLFPVPTTPYDPGDKLSAGSEPYARYYFDATEKRCLPFKYNGQAGNFNNFMSELDCEMICSQVACSRGLPLKNNDGITNKNCAGSDSNCPTTHSCKNNICCPTAEFICSMPKDTGNCADYSTSWWYNAETGNCEKFKYSGCQGNENNFESYFGCRRTCQDVKVKPKCLQGTALLDSNNEYLKCGGFGKTTACPSSYYCYFDGRNYGCCPSQSYTCTLSADRGRSCGPAVLRWYYDSTNNRCDTLVYYGCDGNSNNFATQQDCDDYCGVSNCPDGGDILTGKTGVPVSCSKDHKCPNTHYCTPIAVEFNHGYQKRTYCCPTKSYICSQNSEAGVECLYSSISRYWFNKETRTCATFTYNGCEGNRNNFATKAACDNYCLSSACQEGAVVLQDSSGSIKQCSDSVSCPSGYNCRRSNLLRMNVCCGTAHTLESICPSDAQPYVSAITMQPRQCQPNVQGACPGDYFCWYASESATSSYYCCRTQTTAANKTDLCPPQLTAVLDNNSEYKACSPSDSLKQIATKCGMNSFCQFSSKLSKYICCAASAKPNICPPNLSPVLFGSDYRKCSTSAARGTTSACPSGSACLWAQKANTYICCEQTKTTTTAATTASTNATTAADDDSSSKDCSGQIGFVPSQPYPSTCSPFIATSCDGFKSQGSMSRCLWSSNISKFICCHSQFGLASLS